MTALSCSGEATIITSYDKVPHYLALMAHQLPIESQFIQHLTDHLNAEIVLGTVSNVVRRRFESFSSSFLRLLFFAFFYLCLLLSMSVLVDVCSCMSCLSIEGSDRLALLHVPLHSHAQESARLRLHHPREGPRLVSHCISSDSL